MKSPANRGWSASFQMSPQTTELQSSLSLDIGNASGKKWQLTSISLQQQSDYLLADYSSGFQTNRIGSLFPNF